MATTDKLSKRTWVLVGGAVAALALAGYFGLVAPTSEEGATGTIGAVEKYRADQIKAEDVVVDKIDSITDGTDEAEPRDRLADRERLGSGSARDFGGGDAQQVGGTGFEPASEERSGPANALDDSD